MRSRAAPLVLSAVWIAIGAVMWPAAFAVQAAQNLFDYNPKLTLMATIASVIYFAALCASVALHGATRGPLPMTTAVLAALGVAAMGLYNLPEEALEPGGLLGRSLASPAAYRVGFAAALALPGVLLGVRRWRVDDSDSWFRKHAARLLPPLVVLTLGLLVPGLAGRRANDPVEYDRAVIVLGGPSVLQQGLRLVAFGITMLEATTVARGGGPRARSAPDERGSMFTDEADCRRLFERFLASDQVPDSVVSEVRTACSADVDTHPSRAHACAHDVLMAGRLRTEKRRTLYQWLALAAAPLAAFAFIVLWRSRRPLQRARPEIAGPLTPPPASP